MNSTVTYTNSIASLLIIFDSRGSSPDDGLS